jgi:hypothetical protein
MEREGLNNSVRSEFEKPINPTSSGTILSLDFKMRRQPVVSLSEEVKKASGFLFQQCIEAFFLADYAVTKDIFYAPGCMTPSEIIAAENARIRFIKLFPGDMLGPKFLTTIKDIFTKLLFMPTGGVDTTKESL